MLWVAVTSECVLGLAAPVNIVALLLGLVAATAVLLILIGLVLKGGWLFRLIGAATVLVAGALLTNALIEVITTVLAGSAVLVDCIRTRILTIVLARLVLLIGGNVLHCIFIILLILVSTVIFSTVTVVSSNGW